MPRTRLWSGEVGGALVLLLAAIGCSSTTDPEYVTVPGVIAAAVALPAPVIVAPDTVLVNAQFSITVNSFGTSCATAETASALLGGGTPDVAIVSVWDRQQVGGTCTTTVRALPRTLTLFFTRVGTATIRVRGRYEGGAAAGGDSLVFVEKRVVVQ